MSRIFISYKRVDKKKVFRLKHKVEQAIEEKCWLDLDGIESDEQFVSVIMTAINEAEIVLFMYSCAHKNIKDYEFDWTIRELSYAQKRGKRIVFINLDGSRLTDWFEFNYGLKQQIDARNDNDIKRLLTDLKKWLKINDTTRNVNSSTTSDVILNPILLFLKNTTLCYSRLCDFLKRTKKMLKMYLRKISVRLLIIYTNYIDLLRIARDFIVTAMRKKRFLHGLAVGIISIPLVVFLIHKANVTKSKVSPIPPSPVIVDMLCQEVEKLKNNMVCIEGGTIVMGDTLRIKRFYLCKYEVTQSLWKAVMKSNPSNFKGEDLPVESVTWDDCQDFIKQLNKLSKNKFRLPTEAEWEYAARGGNKSNGYIYSGSDNIDVVAWYNSNSKGNATKKMSHPIGTKRPNELGLYDMSGNVSEWCSTNYSVKYGARPEKDKYIFRGGAWLSDRNWCRTGRRNAEVSTFKSAGVGLRIATSSK